MFLGGDVFGIRNMIYVTDRERLSDILGRNHFLVIMLYSLIWRCVLSLFPAILVESTRMVTRDDVFVWLMSLC